MCKSAISTQSGQQTELSMQVDAACVQLLVKLVRDAAPLSIQSGVYLVLENASTAQLRHWGLGGMDLEIRDSSDVRPDMDACGYNQSSHRPERFLRTEHICTVFFTAILTSLED